jgi:hypothetical protein
MSIRQTQIVAAIAAAIAVIIVAVVVIAGPIFGGVRGSGAIIPVPTAPPADPNACRLSLLTGTLVRHPQLGIAVAGPHGPQVVIWPNGFYARLTEDGAALLDADSRVVAHTGDAVRAAGGPARFGGPEGFAVCPSELEFGPLDP